MGWSVAECGRSGRRTAARTATPIATHTSHDTRSAALNMRKCSQSSHGTVAANLTAEPSWYGIRRSTTVTARRRSACRVASMASPSRDGDMLCQPGTRITLHAATVRPQP